MHRRRLTHKASSAPPSQTPLEGGADDAAPLTLNTVALPYRERGKKAGKRGSALPSKRGLPRLIAEFIISALAAPSFQGVAIWFDP